MFSNFDIAEYYNTTQNHYVRWWDLRKTHALHYGIWDQDIRSFSQSLMQTNRVMAQIGEINQNDKVLDAGCGVGGSAVFLSKEKRCEVVGITLSEKQLYFAKDLIGKYHLKDKLSFYLMDYTQTTFQDESFDVVWACESVCHAQNKDAFIRECFRLLKKGGRLIMSDYFLKKESYLEHNLIQKWMKTWSISNFVTFVDFSQKLNNQGFKELKSFDYTEKIYRCARRYYHISLIGAIPSIFYNTFHPVVSRFARTHYKSGIYQYKALKKKLWEYYIISTMK